MHYVVCSLSISHHNLILAICKIGIPRRSARYLETQNFKKFNENAFLLDIKNSPFLYEKPILRYGVTQGSIPGPLLLLICINELNTKQISE